MSNKDRKYAVRVARTRQNGDILDAKTILVDARSSREAARRVKTPGKILWSKKVQVEELFNIGDVSDLTRARRAARIVEERVA